MGTFVTASKSNDAFLPKCDLKAEGFRPSTYEETILILIRMLLTKVHFKLSLRSARLVVHTSIVTGCRGFGSIGWREP